MVICGPLMSLVEWDRDDAGWLLPDKRTGEEIRSEQEDDPSLPYDVGCRERLPRPDGNGTFLAITGILPRESKDGPGELIARTREAEASDPDAARWPRGKASDDASAVYRAVPTNL